MPTSPLTDMDIDGAAQALSKVLHQMQTDLGRMLHHDKTRAKSWWDPLVLNPILKTRNRAREWMLLTKTEEACRCYKEWNDHFREAVQKAKQSHWRSRLESIGPNVFSALQCIKPRANGQVVPLKRLDGYYATEKVEQADMLFKGTTLIETPIDLRDVDPVGEQRPAIYVKITAGEIAKAVNKLALGKAPGPDKLRNEMLKLTSPTLLPVLIPLFNRILSQGTYPQCWKQAKTAIIQKAHKPDYTNPNAYCPIALLNTIGKTLEVILAKRLAEWATKSGTLPDLHYSGRKGVGTEDAILKLDTWIRDRWSKKKTVVALFLDVQSAYPTVHPDRLIHSLRAKGCPAYLWILIQDFLQGQSTTMHLDDYVSPPISLLGGLPQGSPLSVILYILYNSDLLCLTNRLASITTSIGYVVVLYL